jgi:hypothetical protein
MTEGDRQLIDVLPSWYSWAPSSLRLAAAEFVATLVADGPVVQRCPTCHGDGHVDMRPCQTCDGDLVVRIGVLPSASTGELQEGGS